MRRNEYNNGTERLVQPNPEVEARPNRRRFSAEYKRQIVAEAARCDEPGGIGALLRREGLYSSQLSDWRRQAEAGKLANSAKGKQERKVEQTTQELARLRQENERLRSQVAQAELIMSAQKKLAQAFENALSLGKEVPS
jgi:transposase